MDYAELRGLIRARYKTNGSFAKDLSISECSLSKKLNGASEWTATEMKSACKLLGIPPEKLHHYFFCFEC